MNANTNLRKITRALVSVSDKSQLEDLCRVLHESQVEIISSGGTQKYLQERGLPTTPIEQVTGNPELFQGRMKTLSFQVGSGLLYRRDVPQDVEDLRKLGAPSIDLVVCNLYPFAEKAKAQAPLPELIENIDIGGPTLIRAAAKNCAFVTVLTSPEQYGEFIQVFRAGEGAVDEEHRRAWALQAFQLTASYDTLVAQTLSSHLAPQSATYATQEFQSCLKSLLPLEGAQGEGLRYGENPHQGAHLIRLTSAEAGGSGPALAPILQGKPMSYNNFLDAEAAWKCASDVLVVGRRKTDWSHPCAAVVVKHMNPCGVVLGESPLQVLQRAWNVDPVSSFGGIVCLTAPLNAECAEWLKDKFLEILIVPHVEPQARDILQQKKNLRVLLLEPRAEKCGEKVVRSLGGGLLIQDEDEGLDPEEAWTTPTLQSFPREKYALAHFGIMVAKHLKSNAIALVEGPEIVLDAQGLSSQQLNDREKMFALVSAGMGQPNRVEALKSLALPKLHNRPSWSEGLGEGRQMRDASQMVLISDAFFPFPDTVHEAYQGGLRMIVQPGGSMRDPEVVEACNELGLRMLLTGRRHFRH